MSETNTQACGTTNNAGFPPAPSKARQQASIETSCVMDEDEILLRARVILARRMREASSLLTSPDAVRDYLMMHLAPLEHEIFGVLWLNAAGRLIADDQLFRGTLTQTSVYPRELVKTALARNAASCILYHNHPSGTPEPSNADQMLTKVVKDALALIDVRVMDHLIVAGVARPTSFAERGLI